MLAFDTIAGAPIAGDEATTGIRWGMSEQPGAFGIAGSAALAPVSGYLTRKNFLSFVDFLGAAAANQMISWTEINIGQPDGYGKPIWGGWQKFSPGNYQSQYAKFRVFVQAPMPTIIGELLEFLALCSVPNRIDSYSDLAVPDGGLIIDFTPSNSTTPKPFNKGPITTTYPDGAPLPVVQITFNNQPGDQLIMSDLTLSSITLQVLNGGAGVARTLQSVQAQGF